MATMISAPALKALPIPGLADAHAQASVIAPGTLQTRITTGDRCTVLDLRSAGDFATAHIPGARWLSRGRLDLQIEQVRQAKDGRGLALRVSMNHIGLDIRSVL